MEIVRSVEALRHRVRQWREAGETVGLVPTMGSLHLGHLSLVDQAHGNVNRTVTTIFVNPKQFAPHEDYGSYPRTEDADVARLTSVGCDLLFAPDVYEMYGEGFSVSIAVPGIGDVLEGECRPGFFTGVATVVCKLLLQALPDVAIFGEKDYQQLLVIKRLVADLNIPVSVIGGATIREKDGLALSSRNAYLTPNERAIAPMLHQVLSQIAVRFQQGESVDMLEIWGKAELRSAGFGTIDYLTVRHAKTLAPLIEPGEPARVLGAANLGNARLIDNIPCT